MVQRGHFEQHIVTELTLDLEGFRLAEWDELVTDGSLIQAALSNGAVAEALAQDAGTGEQLLEHLGPPGEPFIELYVGLATPPTVGRNLFGARSYSAYMREVPNGGQVIVVGANGAYDIRGSAYRKQENGYLFDRLRLVQGGKTIQFHKDRYQWISTGGGTGIRSLDQAMLFYVPAEAGFDPLRSWQILLTVQEDTAAGATRADFAFPFQTPAQYVLLPEEEPLPAWMEAWSEARVDAGILGAALVVLTLILALQAPLSRRRRLHRWVRNGFLMFVLVWVGWIAGAQLSIVNVINYALAPFNHFDWGFYLAEPLIVMIAAYTALSLILLGRGVFCGWLCPFGALQELLAQLGRALRLPQWNPTERAQRWLWSIKYVTAVAVVGLAFYSLDMAMTAAEIEPFKTAITSGFTRAAPFVAYAAVLLSIGLFSERFYCRFVCPLGGTLAILGRLHLFDALKRRPQCGSPCHLCERSCPVKAIESSGKIIMSECFQCLDCQVEYYDDTRCPPLVWERKKSRAPRGVPAVLPAAARGPGSLAGDAAPAR
jgi:hypothetical protein